jgi:hypothetical protein
MKEAEVKKRVKELCKQFGAYWFMVVPTGYGRRGVPDFLVCHRGRFIAVETKRAGITEPSPHQAKELAAVAAAGGVSMVINAENLNLLREELER